MSDDTTLPFWFPAVRGKKLTAAFDGGRLSSNGGVMLLTAAARRMGIAEKLAGGIVADSDDGILIRVARRVLDQHHLWRWTPSWCPQSTADRVRQCRGN